MYFLLFLTTQWLLRIWRITEFGGWDLGVDYFSHWTESDFKSPQAEKRSRQSEAHLKVFLIAFHFPSIFQPLDLHDKSYFPFHNHHWGVGVKKGKSLVSQGQTSPRDHVVNPHFHPPKPPPIKIMTTVPPTWVPHLFSIGLIHTPLNSRFMFMCQ